MMASAPRPILNKLQSNPSPPHHGGVSPTGSPRPWGESFNELSRSLQKICGSPSPYGSTELLHSPPSPRTSPIPRLMASPGTKGPCGNGLANSCSGKIGSFQRAISHETNLQLSPNHRPVMVRHEETEAKLEEMLTLICTTQKENERSRNCSQESEPVTTKRRESINTGIKLNIPLEESVRVDDLIVSVTEDHELEVSLLEKTRTSFRVKALHNTKIPETSVLENIICSKTKSTLYIRECSTQHLSLYFGGLKTRYLPVLREDEENLHLRIVFHVPFGINFENIAVKTVDDNVVILGQKGRSPTLSEGGSPPTRPRALSKQCFRVSISLPDNTEPRSITAALSRGNQLILCGKMENLSRRYTC